MSMFKDWVWIRRYSQTRDAGKGVAPAYEQDPKQVNCDVQPMPGDEVRRHGLDLSKRYTKVAFKTDVDLQEKDRIAYQTKLGRKRIIEIGQYFDDSGAGELFIAQGLDKPDPDA